MMLPVRRSSRSKLTRMRTPTPVANDAGSRESASARPSWAVVFADGSSSRSAAARVTVAETRRHADAHLAARRATVGRPLPPDLQGPARDPEALEGGPRPHDDARREREGLDKAPGVATRPEPHRGEPIGEIASGALAAGRAGGASLHLRRRERAHMGEELVGDRRGCRAPRRRGDRREEQDS